MTSLNFAFASATVQVPGFMAFLLPIWKVKIVIIVIF